MKTVLWVLTANRSFAKVYQVKGLGRDFQEILHVDHPDGRKKGSEIFTDRAGRSFDSLGGGRHALGKTVDVHQHDQTVFTKQLATMLQEGLENNAYDALAFVAPSHFLGSLNLAISPGVKKKVLKEILAIFQKTWMRSNESSSSAGYLDLWNHK